MKMETSAKLYSLNYSNVKTYLFARWTDFITNLLFYLNCRL